MYFEGSPLAEEPQGVMPGEGAPQFYMFPCSHRNISIFTKWERSEEIKREFQWYQQSKEILLNLGMKC
jgi:hypothetical protein